MHAVIVIVFNLNLFLITFRIRHDVCVLLWTVASAISDSPKLSLSLSLSQSKTALTYAENMYIDQLFHFHFVVDIPL